MTGEAVDKDDTAVAAISDAKIRGKVVWEVDKVGD
jgi:hypothetical protein